MYSCQISTREPYDSLLSVNVEYLNEIETLLIIEADLKKKKNIVKLKDDSMFLWNYAGSIFHDGPVKKDMEKHKYEQSVSEDEKCRSLIKTVVGRKFVFI